MPSGRRSEARFCGKRCRQASSRFDLGVRAVPGAVAPGDVSLPTSATRATRRPGPGEEEDVSLPPATTTTCRLELAATRRARASADASRAMRVAYADPPYPGKAGYYPEGEEVDHEALIGRLVGGFPDGWALSTSAAALQRVLALCPAGVRVCSWHRAVRPTRSRRPISAWEPLVVAGGRELATDRPQLVRDALAYGGRYRTFPGALVGMKPPQFAAWLFAQLGARRGDVLVDVFPGSGAVGEAWRRYSGQPALLLPAASAGPCAECYGRSHPCQGCITAAGDPAPVDFVLGPGVEQVRRCACGRVYGAYHAGRALCFLMEPPGRRQVKRCVRCDRELTASATSDCTAELAGVDARHVAAGPRAPRDLSPEASRDVSLASAT